MNIQNRMDSSLMMDRAVRKERQKLRSHTKSYRVSGQGADNSKLYDKLISKNQDADKTSKLIPARNIILQRLSFVDVYRAKR